MPPLKEQIAEYEVQVARLTQKLATAVSSRDNLYDKLRLLENRVRESIVIGEQIDPDKLYALRTSVPLHPRPTLSELREAARAKLARR